MSSFSSKREQALEACEKVISGIEDGTISVSSSLLLCKKIARLVNDEEGQEWLDYEYGGYPREANGYIVHRAWETAARHGRAYQVKDDKGRWNTVVFAELCGELEKTVESSMNALKNYSTQGFSSSGEWAAVATRHMTEAVSVGTGNLINSIKTAEKHLSILKSQYYDYAVRWQIELQFGSTAKGVFEEYQEKVDRYYSQLPTTVLQKLNAIEDLMEDGNPERYAQVLTSCRRLWSETAKMLFEEVLPDHSGKKYKTKSGTEIDVSGDHDNNKLSAVIETLQSKATRNTLVGSETIYLVDWMEQINSRQNDGVHHDVTREQAMQCIIHTYIALGDILSLKAEADIVEAQAQVN
nr:hypothetical protein [Clostridia bacterium]